MNLFMDIFERYPQLSECKESLNKTLELLCDTFRSNGSLYVFGNGGSASDAEHFCAELAKGFLSTRSLKQEDIKSIEQLGGNFGEQLQYGLPAFPLVSSSALTSAIANDLGAELCFAQQVLAFGRRNDVVLGISTSGKSKNVVNGLITAKARGLKTIALTGRQESECSKVADITIRVPADEVHIIQELHLPTYHALAIEIEKSLFGNK